MGIYRQKLYSVLKKLKNKGVVTYSPKYPVIVSAVIFEKVLDLFIEARIQQQRALKASKKELLSTWRSITEKDEEES